MISREHAEASRIHGKALMDTELGGKISDAGVLKSLLVDVAPCLSGQMPLELLLNLFHVSDETLGRSRLIEQILRNGSEHLDRIMTDLPPQVDIQAPEEVYRLKIPYPPDVVGYRNQGLDFLRQIRYNLEFFNQCHYYLVLIIYESAT